MSRLDEFKLGFWATLGSAAAQAIRGLVFLLGIALVLTCLAWALL